MNESDLRRLLRGAPAPDLPDAYWDAFPGRVAGRLRDGAGAPVRPPVRLGAWLALAGACGLALGFALWHRPPPSPADPLRDGRVLREWLARYPGRVRSLVMDASGLHPQLSEAPDIPSEDPIWLEIGDSANPRDIVTFSGQLVRCGDRDVMVLSDVGGQVMLIGDGFFWSRQASAGTAERLRIRAQRIPASQAPTRPPSPL